MEALADAIATKELAEKFADATAEFAEATAFDEPADAVDSLPFATLAAALAEDKACEADVWMADKASFAEDAEACAEA